MKKFLKDWIVGVGLVALIGVGIVFGPAFLNNIHNLYIRVLSLRVVKLTNAAGNSGATGFVVKGKSGQKYILTNNHVCRLAENNTLTAEQDGERFPVEVVKSYLWNDLCALKAHRPLGLAVNVASGTLTGETVWVVGHPLLEPNSVTTGEISGTVFIQIVIKMNAKPEECTGPTYSLIDLSQTTYAFFGMTSACVRMLEANASTATILPGNSGSPVVNLWGNVVAVAFAGNESGTRSYFVPLQDVQDFISEL